MDKKEELQLRIAKGQRNVGRLAELVGKLPDGNKKDELAEKSIRMLRSLADLEDGFIEFYPGDCLFLPGKACDSRSKGTFHCRLCPEFYNAVYAVGGQDKLVDL